jgi:hypothetical protein
MVFFLRMLQSAPCRNQPVHLHSCITFSLAFVFRCFDQGIFLFLCVA